MHQRSALGSRLSALGSRLSALGSQLSALGSRLSALGSRLSALGSRLSALSSRLSALGSQLSALGSQLSAQDTRNPGQEPRRTRRSRAELEFGQSLPADLGAPVVRRALESLALADDEVAPDNDQHNSYDSPRRANLISSVRTSSGNLAGL